RGGGARAGRRRPAPGRAGRARGGGRRGARAGGGRARPARAPPARGRPRGRLLEPDPRRGQLVLRGAWLLLERELARLDRRGGKRRLGRVGLLFLLLFVLAGSQGRGPQAPFHALMVTQVVLAL